MQKPQLQISLHKLDYIPEVRYIAKKIQDGFCFIDENKQITINELPLKWIRFWCVEDSKVRNKLSELPIMDDENATHKLLVSLVTFGYLYSRYYRLYDFAYFQNYIDVYFDFQRLLLILSSQKRDQRSALPRLKAFDLANLPDTLDKLHLLGYYPK